MDTGKYKTPPGSEGAPTWILVGTRYLLKAWNTYSTWTLVSTMHILKVMEHYMDTSKHKTPPECKRAPQWTLVCTRHLVQARGTTLTPEP
jgi:hypothetical protein